MNRSTLRGAESDASSTAVLRDARCRRGVLLINLGTPESLDLPAVRRYLAEFLSDSCVIRLPTTLAWAQRPLGHLLARMRARHSLRLYERIWSEDGSPLRTITRDQVEALQRTLPPGWRVFHAMRYGRPGIAETIREIESAGIEELVVVPMYPQFSGTTTGTALREVYAALKEGAGHLNVATRGMWYDDSGYIRALARLLHQYALSCELSPRDTFLVFTTHGLPMSHVRRGDPYPQHVKRTAALVLDRLGWPASRSALAYQSRWGPGEWLEPSTTDCLRHTLARGERKLLVCPVGFPVDCLETLEEIDIRYRAMVNAQGGELFLCPALNSFGPFIEALKDLVLHGSRPVTSWGPNMRPLLAGENPVAGDAQIDSLVMVGAAVGNVIGPGRGPALHFAPLSELRRIKRSQTDVPRLLQALHAEGAVREAFLWNTCRRLELYAWMPDEGVGRVEETIAAMQRHLWADRGGAPSAVNVLRGTVAWHHLLRTAVGLNSQLPGERDIVEQLQAAHRLAECAGTAGRLAQRLLGDVLTVERSLRQQTAWGAFDSDYCYAALSRAFQGLSARLPGLSGVVIGGSTTSAAVLRTLVGRFDVPSRQLTLLYRGHRTGGNLKLLRRAIGNGRRIRVQHYGESAVLRAIAGADLVVFGLDVEQPVLHADAIRGLRDFAARPLTIVDFNLFGSTAGMDALSGVTVVSAAALESHVADYADELCDVPAFSGAVDEAEGWLVRCVGGEAGVGLPAAAVTGAASCGTASAIEHDDGGARRSRLGAGANLGTAGSDGP